jgi:hypothetical protein
MSQSLEVNIKTTSDVPQAMDKAKQATTGFGKQVADIGKKFSTSFKDIFLSFLGPMALLTGALAIIGKMIADNQRKREEANQAAIDDTNALMSAEDRYWAKKNEREKKGKEDAEQAKTQREQTTFEFMSKDPRGYKIYQDYIAGKIGANRENPFERNRKFNAKSDPEVQAAIQALIAEDAKNNPIPEAAADAVKKTERQFKSPEGFGTVIGVGANPVLEAMTRQNELLGEIKVILQDSKPSGGGVPTPFTERLNPASRTTGP